jgi:hypothetical protein
MEILIDWSSWTGVGIEISGLESQRPSRTDL